MKKITICILLLFFSATSFCQQTEPSTSLTKEEYLKKSKAQKAFGFIFLGAGAISIISVGGGNNDLNALGTAVTVVTVGGLLAVASIPLFIASGRNKRKAKNASVSFNFEKNRYLQQSQLSFHTIPAITLKLNL